MDPVAGSRATPAGREPVYDQEYGEMPPEACSVAVYPWPTIPAGKEDVVTVSGGDGRFVKTTVPYPPARTPVNVLPSLLSVSVIGSHWPNEQSEVNQRPCCPEYEFAPADEKVAMMVPTGR
jgi:hypothetical protein